MMHSNQSLGCTTSKSINNNECLRSTDALWAHDEFIIFHLNEDEYSWRARFNQLAKTFCGLYAYEASFDRQNVTIARIFWCIQCNETELTIFRATKWKINQLRASNLIRSFVLCRKVLDMHFVDVSSMKWEITQITQSNGQRILQDSTASCSLQLNTSNGFIQCALQMLFV